jgi:hypothetical protein
LSERLAHTLCPREMVGAPMVLSVERSAIRAYESLVVYRCGECGEPVLVFGALPENVMLTEEDGA